MTQLNGLRSVATPCSVCLVWLSISGSSFAQTPGCADGFVEREAFKGDKVCVTPEARKGASEQNTSDRSYRKDDVECLPGFAWRMAGPEDRVCVSQAERDMAQRDNHQDAWRRSARVGPPLPELKIPEASENVRTPPSQPGCHRYEKGAWRETVCLSEEVIKRHFPPPTPQYSIKSYPKLLLQPIRVYNVPLVFASVDLLHLSDPEASTVTDSKFGVDAFSIQVNTNTFHAKNGHQGWVQFVLQSTPDYHEDALCVWNFDIDAFFETSETSGYSRTCVGVPKQRTVYTAAHPKSRKTTFVGPGAGRSERSKVAGYLRKPLRGPSDLVAWAYVPWAPFSAYSVSAPDMYGLAGHWTEVSGDIMGFGNRSVANFTHAKLRTVIQASACVEGGASFPCPVVPGPALSLSTSAAASVALVTGESSNLTSNYDYGPHPPAFSCLKGSCWLDYSTGLFSLLQLVIDP